MVKFTKIHNNSGGFHKNPLEFISFSPDPHRILTPDFCEKGGTSARARTHALGASKPAKPASLDAPTKEGVEKVIFPGPTFSAPSFAGASKLAKPASFDAPTKEGAEKVIFLVPPFSEISRVPPRRRKRKWDFSNFVNYN